MVVEGFDPFPGQDFTFPLKNRTLASPLAHIEPHATAISLPPVFENSFVSVSVCPSYFSPMTTLKRLSDSPFDRVTRSVRQIVDIFFVGLSIPLFPPISCFFSRGPALPLRWVVPLSILFSHFNSLEHR